jgi:hypothetical protein
MFGKVQVSRISPQHKSIYVTEAGAAKASISGERRCGKAPDVRQLRRGAIDPRCNLPGGQGLGKIAASHGLFEGGRWCNSDYGHAQIGVTAAACGDQIRIVRQ